MTQLMTTPLPNGVDVPRLGLGTWAIGGPWTAGREPAGWGETDDAQSIAGIKAGVAAGIRLFDTAQAYGAGHSERLLGAVLGRHPEVQIVTKVGFVVNEAARALDRVATDPTEIEASLDASRRRLQRDRIDIVLLHLNSLPPEEAAPIFDRLETLRARGWIGHYGWSTDFPASVTAMASRPGFSVVEHAMNVFFAASGIGKEIGRSGLLPLIRSPLAMGLLGGRYKAGHRFSRDDVRSRSMDWMDYFKDGVVTPDHAAMVDKLRDLLATGGRSPAQGALAWLWARNPHVLPVPGFRTPAQVDDLVAALDKGPLDPTTMADIEATLRRPPEGPPRER
jgi:aryl-alcohol dehydrogenase-like predicted oxidoreductase